MLHPYEDSTVPAYSGVTPALDAAVGAIHSPLNQPYIPTYDGSIVWGEMTPRASKKGGASETHHTTTRLDNLENLVRKFDTGATRSADAGRIDPEGFLSPLAIERYCQYMNKNRLQPDGSIRDSDNWQKGIPLMTYMKGLWRHMHHAWTRHRGYVVDDPKAAADIEEDLCAVIFNASGYLHELRAKYYNQRQESPATYKVTHHG